MCKFQSLHTFYTCFTPGHGHMVLAQQKGSPCVSHVQNVYIVGLHIFYTCFTHVLHMELAQQKGNPCVSHM